MAKFMCSEKSKHGTFAPINIYMIYLETFVAKPTILMFIYSNVSAVKRVFSNVITLVIKQLFAHIRSKSIHSKQSYKAYKKNPIFKPINLI